MKFLNKTVIALTSLCLLVSAGHLYAGEKTTTYFHTDSLGSVVAASDEGGDVIWTKTYDPYGNEVTEAQNGNEIEEQTYTGKPTDPETGLVYLGQRYYDPEIRRFMGIDPVGFRADTPVSFNRYAYANNNPYKYVDPDGRAAIHLSRFTYLGGKEIGKRLINPTLTVAVGYFGYHSVGDMIYSITHDESKYFAPVIPDGDGTLTLSATGGPGMEPDDEDDHTNQLDVSAKRARVRLRRDLNTPKGQQAHHNIPWQLRNHPAVRSGARGGFNMNGRMNGTSLGPDKHLGSHPAYTRIVERYLNRHYRPGMTNREAALLLRQTSNRARDLILRGSTKLR